ncbi:hypothetical protein [uncultured Megasphaera sp.]|uniref:hypothetical protein n=1 Tax=uncultured Megasphaera sp. TaxID=165188 RepID=UPI00266BDABA|nr:hypothetical protein [uncultured Megasphaera sp.]
MDDVQAVCFIAFGPAVPRKSSGLIAIRGDEFRDFRFDGKAEGLEAKARVGSKLSPFRVVEFDVRYVVIIGRPNGRIDQVFEGFFGRDPLDDDFVRGKIVGRARQVFMGSVDFM